MLRNLHVWSGPPGFRGKELDLFKVWSLCVRAGGFDRVTAGGLWGHIAVEMDDSINPSDPNDLQSAAHELWDLYRTFCLDIEHGFVEVLAKLQEHRRIQAHYIGQLPLQAPSRDFAGPSYNPPR
ncbi:hypothetical protein PCANC_19574 [Puccinia coronata f. sp. avenae]|uniref:ARID domain-containing protein n=2 Tax=Puccinia coronata f. sp. avenae TaxID=200324 RepID=A0A2N5U4S8_9BASI|nr:hypothetical protein PCANC_19574 [Puccinia coronata f. sp. avenae]